MNAESDTNRQQRQEVARKRDFVSLLCALFLLIFGSPLLGLCASGVGYELGRHIYGLLLCVVLIATAFAVSITRRQRVRTFSLVVLVFSTDVLYVATGAQAAYALFTLASVAFLGYSILLTVLYTFERQVVDLARVAAALCGYLLIGVAWASLYALVAELDPGAFVSNQPITVGVDGFSSSGDRMATAIYFSFVTLTTLGYGDIAPATLTTRMLTTAEALIGQIYLVVLVARLVGIHVAQSTVEKER